MHFVFLCFEAISCRRKVKLPQPALQEMLCLIFFLSDCIVRQKLICRNLTKSTAMYVGLRWHPLSGDWQAIHPKLFGDFVSTAASFWFQSTLSVILHKCTLHKKWWNGNILLHTNEKFCLQHKILPDIGVVQCYCENVKAEVLNNIENHLDRGEGKTWMEETWTTQTVALTGRTVGLCRV